MKSSTPEIPESKAGEILAAAERLFARHGYDGVSMNAVAQEAKVSKANVFHHFGSKEELYLAVLQHVRRELTQDLAAVAHGPSRNAGDDLRRVGELYLNHFLTNDDRVRLFLRENLERRPGQGKAMAEKIFGHDHTALTTLIREAQGRGELRQDLDPATPMLMLVAACLLYFQSSEILKHMPGPGSSDPEQFIQQVVDVLLRGVLTR